MCRHSALTINIESTARNTTRLRTTTSPTLSIEPRPTPRRTTTEPNPQDVNITAQTANLAPVAPTTCDVPQRRVVGNNGVVSRARQELNTKHATIDAAIHRTDRLVPVTPKDLPTFTTRQCCERRAEALTPSNSTTRTEWSIVRYGIKSGPILWTATLVNKQEGHSHIGAQLEVPKIHGHESGSTNAPGGTDREPNEAETGGRL